MEGKEFSQARESGHQESKGEKEISSKEREAANDRDDQ